jgi:hypothetical protein
LTDVPVPQKASKHSRKQRGERPTKPARDGFPARHGTAWSAQEDHRLRTLFLAGEAIAKLAKAHQRKKGAISSRLIKLGLLPDEVSAPSPTTTSR